MECQFTARSQRSTHVCFVLLVFGRGYATENTTKQTSFAILERSSSALKSCRAASVLFGQPRDSSSENVSPFLECARNLTRCVYVCVCVCLHAGSNLRACCACVCVCLRICIF
jgi:hypothetical protein